MMGTIPFSKIVVTAGKPKRPPIVGRTSEGLSSAKAIAADRVMTVHQHSAETKTDFGVVEFEKGVSGQILIFPKSLKRFADKRVVGVKYDLLEWPAVPKNQQVRIGAPKRSRKRKPRGTKTSAITGKRSAKEEGASASVIKFPMPEADNQEDRNPYVIEIKNQVRHALNILEEGKQVAASNLLRGIISN